MAGDYVLPAHDAPRQQPSAQRRGAAIAALLALVALAVVTGNAASSSAAVSSGAAPATTPSQLSSQPAPSRAAGSGSETTTGSSDGERSQHGDGSTVVEPTSDQPEVDTDSSCGCIDALDADEGEGQCAYYLSHFKADFGIDACASLYCANCELSGKCDLTCDLCVDCEDETQETTTTSSSTTSTPSSDHSQNTGKQTSPGQATVVTDAPTAAPVSTRHEKDGFSNSPSGQSSPSHGWKIDAVTGAPSVAPTSGPVPAPTTNDGAAPPSGWKLSAPDSTASSEETSSSEEGDAVNQASGSSTSATPSATGSDGIADSATTSPAVSDSGLEQVTCGQDVKATTRGHDNELGFSGPDSSYLLVPGKATSFTVTACPHSRSDVALWLFHDGDADLATTNAISSTGLHNGCASLEHAETGATDVFRFVVDGSDGGTFQVFLTCEMTEESAAASTEQLSLTVTATNEYADSSNVGASYPWRQDVVLVEPHRMTTFSSKLVDELANEVVRDDVSYRWTIDGDSHTSANPSMKFTSSGEYELELTVTDGDGQQIGHSSTTVVSRYVRREFRSLNEADQTDVMDALSTVYSTSTAHGQRLYGSSFKSIAHFATKYTALSASSDCDHMSSGLGYLTNHAALVGELEASLQAVKPHVALPYWDFSIDAALAHSGDSSTTATNLVWRHSPLFDADAFGDSAPQNDEHTMTEGRWALTRLPSRADNSSELVGGVFNAYGTMRAPWNLNDSPFVSRYDHLFDFLSTTFADCRSVSDVLQLDTWSDFAGKIQDMLATPTAEMIAGTWSSAGSGLEWAQQAVGAETAESLARFSVTLAPYLYRAKLLTCPSFCTANSPPSECQCSCAAGLSDDFIAAAFDRSGALDRLVELDINRKFTTSQTDQHSGKVTHTVDADTLRTLWQMTCRSPVTGDLGQASAPMDPLFWVTHAAVERVWQAKRLSECSYKFEWSDSDSSASCSGHKADDVVAFGGSGESGPVTNLEMHGLLDPTTTGASYVYDSHEWAHCMADGIDVSKSCEAPADHSVATPESPAEMGPGSPAQAAPPRR